MTGVGAIFELYNAWAEGGKKKEKEEPKLEPDEDEVAEGYEDQDSDWHYVINNEAWDDLLDMLQTYDFKLYKPKEPDKKKRRLRVVGCYVWMKDKILTPKVPEDLPISPILGLNENGETPVHVAIRLLAPDKHIIRMIFCEKRAALVADKNGRLPLHISCLNERNTQVIDRLIRANFHHMQREDNSGSTALMYAIYKAKEKRDFEGNPDCYWGIPRNRGEAEWQERQETIWAKVRFILLSYSTRRKIFVDAERNILLDVLEHAAPPAVVEVTILAAQGMLHLDPTLASSALKLFMKREYPIKNLQLLLHHFPHQNVESVEAARKLLTEQYFYGCHVLPGREFSFREEMEKHALEEDFRRSLQCQEWWNKIQCLLGLCGHQNAKQYRKKFENKFLLHASLSNSDTPPSLVQLLMVLNPQAILLPHPFNNALLIHLVCFRWRYNLYPHSRKIGLQHASEEPPMEQVLKILLASDSSLTRKRYRGRLPLHFAVATSKSLDFLDALVQKDRKTLSLRDPQTRLYPFQMAAMGGVAKKPALWAHAKYGEEEWKRLEPDDRATAVEKVIQEQEAEQLNTIYYLLRQFPAAITPGVIANRAYGFRDTEGKGMVSAHYLKFLYRGDDDDSSDEDSEEKSEEEKRKLLSSHPETKGTTELSEERLLLFRKAIKTGIIPKGLEDWFSKLKFWIRYSNPGHQSFLKEDQYLLHAAVANSDVPPLIIQLLSAVYPTSATLPVPQSTAYPLHIASCTAPYQPQIFESIKCKSVLEILVEAYPAAYNIESQGVTPMVLARATGTRTEDELDAFAGRAAKAITVARRAEKEDNVYVAPKRFSLDDFSEDEGFQRLGGPPNEIIFDEDS